VAVEIAIQEGVTIGRALANVLRTHPNVFLCMKLYSLIPQSSISLGEVAVEVDVQILRAAEAFESFVRHKLADESVESFVSGLGYFDSLKPGLLDSIMESANERGQQLPQLLERLNTPIHPATSDQSSHLVTDCEDKDLAFGASHFCNPCEKGKRAYEIRQNASARMQIDRAEALHNLARSLMKIGRRQEALAPIRQAVGLLRVVASRDQESGNPALAGSMNSLVLILNQLGRHEEALVMAREAVEICRTLALPRMMATLLGNLTQSLSAVGRIEEALTVSQEAVEIHRVLLLQNGEICRSSLAMSLTELAIMFSQLERPKDALAPIQESIDIWRVLVRQNPDKFLSSQAVSLHTLGIVFVQLGRLDEALAPSEEAVEIERHLAVQVPEANQPRLAGSLTNLAMLLSRLQRHEEAISHAREAVEIYAPWEERFPAVFKEKLAHAKQNLKFLIQRQEETKAISFCQQESVFQAHDISNGVSWPSAQAKCTSASIEVLGQAMGPLNVTEKSHVERLRNASSASYEELENARGVCLLRAGHFSEALNLFRGLVIADNSSRLRNDVPAHFATNFATALLLCGKVTGCEMVLRELQLAHEVSDAASRLRSAVEKARRSLNWVEKLKVAIGLDFPKPVKLDFPPGNFEPSSPKRSVMETKESAGNPQGSR